MAKHPHRLNVLASGSCDGELRVWNLADKSCMHASQLHTCHHRRRQRKPHGHRGFVRGVCFAPNSETVITVCC